MRMPVDKEEAIVEKAPLTPLQQSAFNMYAEAFADVARQQTLADRSKALGLKNEDVLQQNVVAAKTYLEESKKFYEQSLTNFPTSGGDTGSKGGGFSQSLVSVEVPAPTATPITPTTSATAVTTMAAKPVKTATPDIVIFDDESVPVEVMADLIFENIGGQELINVARNDIVNGQQVIYQPIKNLSILQQQFNPNNIVSLQQTSDKYFAGFSIKLEDKIPQVGTGPNDDHVYIDNNTGDLIIETTNTAEDEQIEVEITSGGTIYEANL